MHYTPAVLGHTFVAALWAPLHARSSQRVARAFGRFALAEDGSALTMRWAAAQTRDPKRAALYLRHAIDERRHARAMRARARELDKSLDESLEASHADGEDLFAMLGERRFLAFVTLAERRGLAELGAHQRAMARAGDARSSSVLDAILVDEARHASYSRQLLGETCGSERSARFTLVRVALWETRRAVFRHSATMFRALYGLLMALLFVVLVPPLSFYARWLQRRVASGASTSPPRPR
jgi:hypothetical protein